MKNYDVVIVGGSIAGSLAARDISEKGLKVLLVESARTPREKPCSAIQFKYFERIIGKKIPKERLCSNELTKLYMERPNGKSFKIRFKMINFTRDVFDDWLNVLAIEAGTEFRNCTRCEGFKHVDDGFVVSLHPKHGDLENVKTKYLVAADGLSSSIRKKIRPQDYAKKPLAPTMNYYIKASGDGGLDPNTLYQFWNLEYNNLMFAWTYKKNDLWVVGTAHTNNMTKRCDSLLEHVKQKFNFDGKIVKREGYASRFCLGEPDHVYLGKDNLFFIGDAAGLVDMYRGLGMDAAALSGRRVARAINRAEKNGKSAFHMYEKSMRKTVRRIDKNSQHQLLTLKTNDDLLRHLKKSFMKAGMGTFFGTILNKFLPANRVILLPL